VAEVEVKGQVMASVREFVGFGLAVLADVKRGTDTLGLEISWEAFASVVALKRVGLILCEGHGQYER
jgi:hypothetical protein